MAGDRRSVGTVRFRKVADTLLRCHVSSFPATTLAADRWSLAVGDAGDSINLWQMSTNIYSGQSVSGLVSASSQCGSALFSMFRPGELASLAKLWIRVRIRTGRSAPVDALHHGALSSGGGVEAAGRFAAAAGASDGSGLHGMETERGRGVARVRVLVGLDRAPSAAQHYAVLGPWSVPDKVRGSDGGDSVEVCEEIVLPPCLANPGPGRKSENAVVHFLVLSEVDEGAEAARQDALGVAIGFWQLTPHACQRNLRGWRGGKDVKCDRRKGAQSEWRGVGGGRSWSVE